MAAHLKKILTARLLINDGKGNLKMKRQKGFLSRNLSTYAGAIFDFNHDGHPDIILSALKIPPFQPMQIQALQNDGKGNFKLVTNEVIPESTVGRSWGIAIGDVNKDGKTGPFYWSMGDTSKIALWEIRAEDRSENRTS